MNKKLLYESIMKAVAKEVKRAINEEFMFEGECCGDVGGLSMSYNTPMNTVGVGDVIPAGRPAMTGAAQASDAFNGSGDIMLGNVYKPKNKKRKNSKRKRKVTTHFPMAIKK